jgi:hypothetical protein
MQPSFCRACATLDRENCLTQNTVVCSEDAGCPSMRVIRAVATIVLLAAPAFASAQGFGQNDHVQQAGEKPAEKSRQEIEADKAADRAYQKSLSNIPDHAVSDPWGNVRSDIAPKAPSKAPAKRTKVGGTAQ